MVSQFDSDNRPTTTTTTASADTNNMVCAVCGQPHARNNFGCISCNACAAFFRRSIIQERKYLCICLPSDQADGSPSQSVQNVRECKCCRFQKCHQAGMQTKAIRSFEVWKWKLEKASARSTKSPRVLAAGPEEKSSRSRCSREMENNCENADGNGDEVIRTDEEMSAAMQISKSSSMMLLPDDVLELGLLAGFLYAEDKLNRIHHSVTELGEDYILRFSSPEEIVGSVDNLLGRADNFQNKTAPAWGRDVLIYMEQHGLWCVRSDLYIRDLLISIGFAKTLPVFNKLNFNDQKVLLCSLALPALDLFICYYSHVNESDVIITPNKFPVVNMFTLKRYQHDPIVAMLAKKVYCLSMLLMNRVAPSREEFSFLLGLMFTNPAVNGLSPEGQRLLRAESEYYGRAMLRHQQRRLGDAQGALRYSETLALLGQSIANAHKHRELVVYMDLLYEQGRFAQKTPRAFMPFCIEGPSKLPDPL